MTTQPHGAKVWKFAVPIAREFKHAMPHGAEIVFVGVTPDGPQMWARVPDVASELVVRHFAMRGTGHDVEGYLSYIGTFLLDGGLFVGHVFEDAN